jgi:hypothetical protein
LHALDRTNEKAELYQTQKTAFPKGRRLEIVAKALVFMD